MIADPQRSVDAPMHEFEMALRHISGLAPDFTVLLGDLVEEPDGEDGEKSWRRITRLLKLIVHPFKCCIGNHDASAYDDDYSRRWKTATGMLASRDAFEVDGISFFILDTTRMVDGRPSHRGALGDEQLEWLASRLHGLTASDPVVIFSHNPLALDEPWGVVDSEEFAKVMDGRRHVVCFSGHLHKSMVRTCGTVEHRVIPSISFSLGEPRWLAWAWQELDLRHGTGRAELHGAFKLMPAW